MKRYEAVNDNIQRRSQKLRTTKQRSSEVCVICCAQRFFFTINKFITTDQLKIIYWIDIFMTNPEKDTFSKTHHLCNFNQKKKRFYYVVKNCCKAITHVLSLHHPFQPILPPFHIVFPSIVFYPENKVK